MGGRPTLKAGGRLGKIDRQSMQKELQLLEKKHCIDWQEYEIGELFDVDSWVYGKNKQYESRLENKTEKSIEVISGITVNNGVCYYTEDILLDDEIFENELTISTRGEYSGTVTYHPNKFVLANNILVMKMPNLSAKQKIYFATLINKLHYGGYSGYPRKETLKTDKILVPTSNNKIAFAYIEEFLATLAAERLATLDAYLTTTNLKDYTLTKEERDALESFERVEWGKFSFNYLFNNIQQGARLKKADQLDGDIPFIMAGTTNTGVVKYISNPVRSFPKNSLTIDIFGNTFYRDYSFGAGDDTGVFWNDDNKFDKYQMLFLTAQINKALAGKYDYGYKLRSSQTTNFEISLPVKPDHTPDFAFMSTYIKAMQKIVIKNVVEWADKRIEKTKKVIEGNIEK